MSVCLGLYLHYRAKFLFESKVRILWHLDGLVIASPKLHQLFIVSIPVRPGSP